MKKRSTKRLVLLAMLVALQVVCSKFLMVQAAPSVRLSIDATPILLSGLWFGPLAGLAVGTLSDMLGTILFPTAGAWYPPLTLAFSALGLIAGLLKGFVDKKRSFPRVALAVAASELAACFLLKTYALSQLFGVAFFIQLLSRLLPCCINFLADVILVYALDRAFYGRVSQDAPAVPVPSEMTVDDALSYIHSVDWRGSVLGLERIDELLELLGRPERKLQFVHVAGTNGKGSTCAMIASILTAAGYKTGLYISPFINRFNERIQLDGQCISDQDLTRVTAIVKAKAEGMADPPTEFELVTAIGLYYFWEQRADWVTLEVGMGGRLDATNVIPVPALAVITNIGLDHTKILGDDIPKIAFEKAGIIKAGGDVVVYGDNPEALRVFSDVCRQRGATLTAADFSRIQNVRPSLEKLTFDFGPYAGLTLPLTGSYQLKNAAVALTAIDKLNEKGCHIPESAVYAGLAAVSWPGRFELLHKRPVVIVDGGHNPQGVAAAVESLRLHFPGKRAVILLGIMADKDVSQILSLLSPAAERFVTVTPDNPRAMPAGELSERLTALGCRSEAAASVQEGLARAMALAGEDGLVLALGSLYMSGDVRKYFSNANRREANS